MSQADGTEEADQKWAPTQRQIERAERSKDLLNKLGVPTYWGPLFVDDDDAVELRSPTDVANRALVLWLVARTAERVVRRESAMAFLRSKGLWESVSPKERSFLERQAPDTEEVNLCVWRLEALVALLWALGRIEKLDWPDRLCKGRLLKKIMKADPTFPPILDGANLRPKSEIIDAQDMAMRQHWALRNAMLSAGLPGDLTFVFRRPGAAYGLLMWREGYTRLNMGVVAERHYALNWLTRYLSAEGWDDVDTPT